MNLRHELANIARHRNAYAVAASACLGSVFFGWDTGIIGGIISLPSFQSYFGLDHQSASAKASLSGNIVAILQAGCFFGALFTGYFSGKYGRKKVLVVSGIIYVIGSVIQCIVGLGSSQAVGLRVLYFSRFFAGLGIGLATGVIPTYISECTPRVIRGRCTGMIQLANNAGLMLSFWVNYASSVHIPYSEMQWRMPLMVQNIPGVLFIVCMLFQVESPRWLVEQGQYDRAAETLAHVARTTVDDPAVILTLNEIKADFSGKQRTSMIRQFRMLGESRSTMIRSFIPSLVMFFQQWTGTNAVNYYSPEIFASMGINSTTSGLLATGVYGVVKVVAVGLVLMFAVEKMGRKNCLIWGGLGQAAMMLWITGFSAIHPQDTVVPASYVSIVAVYLYAVFYCIGWGPVPWVVASEVAPNHVRTAAMSLAIGTNWLFSFTISKITPIMLDDIKYGTFLVFGLMCFIMAIWAYIFLPETSGYALEDVKYLFEADILRRALWDAPGGRMLLPGASPTPVSELRRIADEEQEETIIVQDEKHHLDDKKIFTTSTSKGEEGYHFTDSSLDTVI